MPDEAIMYGMVNKAIESLVTSAHGEQAWARIAERAGLSGQEFVGLDSYPDEFTYNLVGATCAELGAEAADVLRSFGRYWVGFAEQSGYMGLLTMIGSDFETTIAGLNGMHSRIAVSFPELVPPDIQLGAVDGSDYEVIYRSTRPGLEPMLEGLLLSLAEHFGQHLEVLEVTGEANSDRGARFRVRLGAAEERDCDAA